MNYEYEVKIGEPATIPLGVDNNSVELSAEEIPIKVPQIAKTTDVLKGDDNGNAIAAEAGVDYQTPLEAGVDYQTPLTAGMDYQTPLTAGTDYQTPLPSQSGKSGKYLKTDGSDMSWADVPVPPVTSVNNKTGAVTLGAADVGALPDSYTPPVTSVNGSTGAVVITASGLGAYEKPAGGIPAADLADYYAASATAGGTASKTEAIPYGVVDNTSTSTVYTATVPGITELKDGTMMLLKNGVITSAAGFTIDINNLGAKPVYTNLAAATAESTKFNVNYTMLYIYDSTRVAGGCWICYNGYDSNTNTIAYQVRGNYGGYTVKTKCGRYRILFTSADGTKYVPANSDEVTSAAKTHTTATDKIDPFGRIVYYGSSTVIAANGTPGVSVLWSQYNLSLGYSFNWTNAALVLSYPAPVYVKCAPQSDGSAIIDSTTPYVQSLPSTEDGKIYIFLGIAYSATSVELFSEHPVYYYKDSAIRLWTNAAAAGGGGSSLPAVTAADNGDVLTVVEGEWTKAAPSGGGDIFKVSFGYDEVSEQYTADATYTDIMAAITAGKVVIGIDEFEGERTNLELARYGETGVVFVGINMNMAARQNGSLFFNVLAITSNNEIVDSGYDYTLTPQT